MEFAKACPGVLDAGTGDWSNTESLSPFFIFSLLTLF